jgi:NitT/TauT family transport system substrate-binding protein
MRRGRVQGVRGPLAIVVAALAALVLSACASGSAEPGGADEADTATDAPQDADEAATDPAVEARPAKVATASNSMAAGPLLTALALDTFSEHGIAIEEVPFSGSSTNVVAAVMSGETEFGFLGATAAMNAIAEGGPIVMIGGVTKGMQELGLRPEVIEQLGVDASAPIEDRVEALRGLTIATSAPGSANNAFLTGILQRFGLDPESDVSIVPSEPAAIVAGIRDGLYDGGFWSIGVLQQNFADGSAEPWISVPDGDVEGYDQFFQAVMITNETVAAEDPELVESFIAAMRDAGDVIEQDPDRSKNAVNEQFFPELEQGIFDLTWQAAVPAFVLDATITESGLQTHLDLQAELEDADYSQVSYEEHVHPAVRE